MGMKLTHLKLAKAIGVAASQLTNWRKAGMPSVSDEALTGGPVTYDLADVFHWVRDSGRFQEAAESGAVVPAMEQALLARERRLKIELDRKAKAGELVSAVKVRRALFPVMRSFRDGLLAVPDRVSSILAASSDETDVRSRLSRELRGTLDKLESELDELAASLTTAAGVDEDATKGGDDE